VRRPPRSARLSLLTVAAVAGAAALAVLAYRAFVPYELAFNTTHSIPQGLYFAKAGGPAPLERGQAVCFAYVPPAWAQGRDYFEPGRRLCKYVAALPGDQIVREGLSLTISSPQGLLLLATGLSAADSKGQPLPLDALETGAVPEGKVLLLAPANKNSLDSRYLGLIRQAALSHQIWPLWVKQ
jgi:type IV secretory pathway protease TraF